MTSFENYKKMNSILKEIYNDNKLNYTRFIKHSF